MAVPLLRPGQTHAAVPRMKKELVRELLALELRPLAALIRPDSKTYGKAGVTGVKKFQEKKGLGVDGVVGKDTWRALGIDDEVVDVARKVLNGVPGPEPGVVESTGAGWTSCSRQSFDRSAMRAAGAEPSSAGIDRPGTRSGSSTPP